MTFLYHGTGENVAIQALKNGLLTRLSSSVASNWPKAESHHEQVYLTTTYAPFFASQASGDNERMAIIEIDMTRLDVELFRPDEDFLEQASRKQKVPGLRAKTMLGRTRWFRNNIDRFADAWKVSLDNMGTVAYRGDIPSSSITRVSLFDPNTNPFIESMSIDPTINIMNYRFMGQKYIELTKWFFNEPVNDTVLLFGSEISGGSEMLEQWRSQHQKMIAMNQGIEIISVGHAAESQ